MRISGWSSMHPTELLPANTMKSLEQKSCSSCGESFACGAERGEERCWCDDLPHVSLVANEDRDCFCPQCLREAIQKLNCASTSAGAGIDPPIKTGESSHYSLVEGEGEDYYLEGEAIVFTARYHLRRGYCCESGCRHCPYLVQYGN
jgi:hypothetical protein